MKKSGKFLSFLLFLFLNQWLVIGATIKPIERSVGKLHFSIDPRMELLSTVQLLSDYPVVNRKLPYSKDIITCFASFSPQKAVAMTDSLRQKYGFGYDAPVIFMLYLSQLPELEPQINYSDYLIQQDYLMRRSGRGDNLEQYRKSIKQFAETSGFEEFWNTKISFYNQVLELTISNLPEIDMIKAIEEYFNETQESYNIIIAPAFRGGYGLRIPGNNRQYNIFACLSTDKMKNKTPYLGEKVLLYFVWHEFGHSFVNPVTEQYSDRVASLSKMFEPIKEKMARRAYGEWETVVKEHILRAAHIRLTELHLGYSKARAQKAAERRNGFIYIEPLVEKLKEFEKQRDESNITFSDFFPELLNTLDDLNTMEYWKQVNTGFSR
jgi:hypothetical protein